jgi:type I restriction enzyme S subunit
MNSVVPDGWALEAFGKYIDASVAGEWGKESAGDENDIPVLRSTNFTASGIIDYSKLAIRNIEEKKRVKKGLVSGDVVLEKSGGSPTQPVGRVVYFENDKPFLFSNFTQKLSPSNDCDSKYLFYVLYKAYQDGIVNKFQQQTTGIINFQLAEYLLYKTPFPPLPEQKKIASILTSVDEVIEKTESQIAKLQDLKTGMMQELLTKGIGPGGAPHTEFKDSPVGRIPVGWEVITLGELAALKRGHDITKSTMVAGCYPVVSSSGISGYHNEFTSKGPNVVVGRKGSIGTVHYMENDFWAHDTSLYVTNFFGNNEKFVFYKFSSMDLGQYGTKSGSPSLNRNDIHPLKIPVPPLGEQIRISEILSNFDTTSTLKLDNLKKLKAVKKALMQDLLTGKVRVKTD